MSAEPIDSKKLDFILQAGIRVPDHGGLAPWKLIVIKGSSLKKIDEEIILPEFLKNNTHSSNTAKIIESTRMQRAAAVIAVISTPVAHLSIPKWEMHLSSGAVCMNLLSCAQSLGFAAQWLTEWYAYNEKMLIYLGGRKKIDKISGFIYIGKKIEEPSERKRPILEDKITYI